MKKVFNFGIPVWAFLLFVFGTVLGMLAVFAPLRVQIFEYTLALPPGAEIENAPLAYGEQSALSDQDFFMKVKNNFIMQRANFVEADLSKMVLSLYEAGALATTVPILTKGKEGSWWETPAGIYKIITKEENHFSTFGKVYQPWSMSFQGNFFIHGWPYYSDGTPVSSSYSGGCVRLSTRDAETIFNMAKVGMPVLVFKEDFLPDNFQYQTRVPKISALNYLVADIQNNFVFLDKNKIETIPFDDFSQLLGSLIATDYINIEKNIKLYEKTLIGAESPRFILGDTITPYDLLHPLLLDSDESAFRIFGNIISENRFVSLMNDKARAVGMGKTEFVFSAASPETRYGTTNPEDLFYLAKYIYHNRKFVFDISTGRRTNLAYDKSRFANIENQNIFYENKKFVGGKAIQNEDGTQSFFGVFEIPARGKTRPVFIFLQNSSGLFAEVSGIINFIQDSYQ